MINRRTILGGALKLGLGGALHKTNDTGLIMSRDSKVSNHNCDPQSYDYEQMFAAITDLVLYGLPRSWSMVRDGFHPVAPERVMIVPEKPLRLISTRCGIEIERIKQQLRSHSATGDASHCGLNLSEKKLDLILAITGVLTIFYGRDDCFEPWAVACCSREKLASTGMANGFGLAHQFQPIGQSFKTFNPPVDWWLFLFPGGVDWGNYDDRPLFWMIIPIFARRQTGFEMRVLERIIYCYGHVLQSEPDALAWGAKLAIMDRVSAARVVNLHVAKSLMGQRSADSEPNRRFGNEAA